MPNPTIPDAIYTYYFIRGVLLPWKCNDLALMLSSPRHSFGPIGKFQSRPSPCLGKCECSLSPDSSWMIESGNPSPIPNDDCINIMLSMRRQYRQGTLAPCKNFVFGFFSASNLLWALGGSMLRTIPFELVFWGEIKHYGNEFSASYWPVLNAFFSFATFCSLPHWSSSPRLVITNANLT